jgi:hypothetical protein
VQGLLIGEHGGGDGLDDLLVNVGQIGSGLTDQPLLSSAAEDTIDILDLLASTKAKSLVGLDDDGRNGSGNLDLNTRGISAGSTEEPLITSQALLSIKSSITNSTKAQGSVGRYDLQGGDVTHQLLSGVQGEGRLLEADLLISVAQLDLSRLLGNNVSLGITVVRGGKREASVRQGVKRGEDSERGGKEPKSRLGFFELAARTVPSQKCLERSATAQTSDKA